MYKVELFEQEVKKRFIEQPGQMKLLIVVDKLLTGFDAPPATYLYIDKNMQDHGLFQAICRVNRLDGEDKEYGYIIDYKDLFRSLEQSIQDYTGRPSPDTTRTDVEGLLKDRLEQGRARWRRRAKRSRRYASRSSRRAIRPPTCATSARPRAATPSSSRTTNRSGSRSTSWRPRTCGPTRTSPTRCARPATPMPKRGDQGRGRPLREGPQEVKLASGDYVDMKMFEPAMRHLLDTYIRAEESEKVSAFEDLTLVELIVERGEGAVDALPDGIRNNREAMAETIENNVRRLIIDEMAVNPKYYEKMSELLDALIEQRRQEALDYQAYLRRSSS
jgi:type I restriction enzyme, R subunit